MKRKKIFCWMLTFVVAVSCFSVSTAAAESTPDEVPGVVVRAIEKFDMEVPANSTAKADSSFSLEAGEIVTIKATYSPFTASVDFGLIAPDGFFYNQNTTTGVFDEAIEVNQRGRYYLAIRNNSSENVSVSGYVNY